MHSLQVLVKDHLGKPVSQVPVVLVEQHAFKQDMASQEFANSNSYTTHSNGIAIFISNIPRDVTKVVLRVRNWTCGPCLHLCLLFC